MKEDKATAKQFIQNHTSDEVSFSTGDVLAKLPQIAHNNPQLVKVTHHDLGNLFVASEVAMDAMIEEALEQRLRPPSLFEGMESFPAGDPIGLDWLKDLEPEACEHSDDDLSALDKLTRH
ncbi:hypothetical protein [Ferrimonas marina]|uniref:Uncharacterized protein n=1 Tax=Ferrimonas marina TaxID=299255 RepID=A0A1M5TQN3_9GAMM|nr:hypothetical protein [Ferrimonas marina]SHH52970.1 hypothetical protein SAMN02745129_2238 [Ferrimonas marina]